MSLEFYNALYLNYKVIYSSRALLQKYPLSNTWLAIIGRRIYKYNFHMGRFYYVYVLVSEKDKKMYVGYTKDLRNRIQEHNGGKNKSTENRRPLKLVYYEAHRKKTKALNRERYFKTTKGKRLLYKLIKD